MGVATPMATSYRAHRATAQDADSLRRLFADATQPRASLWSLRRDRAGAGADPAAWLAARSPVVVVGDGQTAVGFAAALPEGIPLGAPRCAEAFVYVDPAYRRRGSARAAMTELITASRTMGLWKLVAYALVEDAAARGLLTRFDFRDVGTLVKHVQIENGWHDVVLSERLVLAARKSLPSATEA
jgi:L-amino acid N-acyltransferase YncA